MLHQVIWVMQEVIVPCTLQGLNHSRPTMKCVVFPLIFFLFLSLGRSSSGPLVESSAVGTNCVFLASGWQQVFTHFALRQMEKIPHTCVLFLQVRVTSGVVSSRLGSADRMSRRLERPLLSSYLQSFSQEVCWLWSGWVRLFFFQVTLQPVCLWDESVQITSGIRHF